MLLQDVAVPLVAEPPEVFPVTVALPDCAVCVVLSDTFTLLVSFDPPVTVVVIKVLDVLVEQVVAGLFLTVKRLFMSAPYYF